MKSGRGGVGDRDCRLNIEEEDCDCDSDKIILLDSYGTDTHTFNAYFLPSHLPFNRKENRKKKTRE